jgi:hypothetical protein
MQSTKQYKEELDKKDQTTGLFALFKGESGAGKSTGALSFPKPYVFDFDFKMPGIALKHFPKNDVYWDTFRYIWDVDEQLQKLMADCPFETIIVDSFTGLANIAIASAGVTKSETVPELLKKFQGRDKKVVAMMSPDYYSFEDRFCTYFIEQLKVLWAATGNPRHVIVTAHVIERQTLDVTTGVTTKWRSIVSKGKAVGAWLPTQFDNMYIFGTDKPRAGDINKRIRRLCLTESLEDDMAKSSMSFDSMVDFTDGSLYNKLYRL